MLFRPGMAREVVEACFVKFIPMFFAGYQVEAVPGNEYRERLAIVLR